jgi:hypothetical protein
MRFVNNVKAEAILLGVVDIVGCGICGLLIAWLAFRNKQTPDHDVEYDLLAAILIFVLLGLAYTLGLTKFGNTQYFGIPTIVITSFLGSLSYVVLSILVSTLRGGIVAVTDNGTAFYGVMLVLIFLVSFIVLTLNRALVGSFSLFAFHRIVGTKSDTLP